MGSYQQDPPPYHYASRPQGYGDAPQPGANEQPFELRPGDIVFGVMGMTGVGKSTFISLLTEPGRGPEVGHNLQSCTSEVEIYPCTLRNGVRVVLVDTPGFDDTNKTDTDVLRDIADFLGTTYANKILLTGIIYLHRITDVRVQGSAVQNLRMFKSLCGVNSLPNVVLVTTMWSRLLAQNNGREIGEDRLRDLRENFWGDMLQRGSKMLRHDGSLQSAEEILGYLISQRRTVVLDIQSEMVTEGLDLSDTTAGQELNAEMRAQQKKFEEDIRRFQQEAAEARREQDFDSALAMEKLQEQHRKKVKQIENDKKKLEVSLEKLRLEEQQRLEQQWRLEEAEQSRTQSRTYSKKKRSKLGKFGLGVVIGAVTGGVTTGGLLGW